MVLFFLSVRYTTHNQAVQKLSDLSIKFGTKAILSFLSVCRENANSDTDIEQDR